MIKVLKKLIFEYMWKCSECGNWEIGKSYDLCECYNYNGVICEECFNKCLIDEFYCLYQCCVTKNFLIV